MKEKKIWIMISAVLGFTAVAIGAFGAHRLKGILSPEMMIIFETGIFYHLIHSVVLLILSLTNIIKTEYPSIFFLSGIILFSFSLYVYSVTGIRLFSVITPFGGVCFLIGWLWVLFGVVKKQN